MSLLHHGSRALLPRRLPSSLRRFHQANRRLGWFSTEPEKEGRVIFSGIQPTGVPHLGNYLGALKQWKKLQDDAAQEDVLLYSIVDLHAITVKQDPKQLAQWRRETLAALLAVGLDPTRSSLFYQSDVPQHAELMWILSCNASLGYLSRMTQWKSKLSLPENASPLNESARTKLKLGLFSYPVLQAADILVHRATHVPVGADQAQHLEFAREIAGGFNHLYPYPRKTTFKQDDGEDGISEADEPVLVQPETIISPARRVMSLTNPTMKMSKSDPNPKSRILITDSKEDIHAKIRGAVTDSVLGPVSYSPANRPGVSNLLEIIAHLEGHTPDEMAEHSQEFSLREFKEQVAEIIDFHVSRIRERYEENMQGWDVVNLDMAADYGAEEARNRAMETMRMVREAIGFGPPPK